MFLLRWVTFYYQHPEPENIPNAIKCMSQTGWFDNKNKLSPIFGFLAGVFKENPKKVPEWIEILTSDKEAHINVVIFGVWYANLPNSQKLVYKILDKHKELKKEFSFLYKGSPLAIEKIPLEQGAWVLDGLWGNFMATGNKTPVARIMTALPWVDIKGDINRLMVGGAAQWSLKSNASQHPHVLSFCKTEINEQPKDVAKNYVRS
ncbi:MAG: hypothetical protein KZQ83_17970 [gamma proteobacterium symbiont of Taylorina sp.]|nr:hypothetical protein [gamma proteobacterium symbiont of Taylorina sp.]